MATGHLRVGRLPSLPRSKTLHLSSPRPGVLLQHLFPGKVGGPGIWENDPIPALHWHKRITTFVCSNTQICPWLRPLHGRLSPTSGHTPLSYSSIHPRASGTLPPPHHQSPWQPTPRTRHFSNHSSSVYRGLPAPHLALHSWGYPRFPAQGRSWPLVLPWQLPHTSWEWAA